MGLSIHYNGIFNKNASLSELIGEVKEIAETFNWKFKIYNKQFRDKENDLNEKDIYGITIIPPGCEPVPICFLANRKMSAHHLLMFWGDTEQGLDNQYLYLLSSKTQYAGINIHKAIIKIFKHLVKQDYFEKFEMFDEGEYWETNDEKRLEANFKEYNALIDNFSLAFETTPSTEKETLEQYIERVLKKVTKLKREKDEE